MANPLIDKVRKQETVNASELLKIKAILQSPTSTTAEKLQAMERFEFIKALHERQK